MRPSAATVCGLKLLVYAVTSVLLLALFALPLVAVLTSSVTSSHSQSFPTKALPLNPYQQTKTVVPINFKMGILCVAPSPLIILLVFS